MDNIEFMCGDLIDVAKTVKADYVVHGCNCFNTMGAGVAKVIADRYPNVYEADRKSKYGDINKLGTVTYAQTIDGFYIFNAYTQHGVGRGENVVYVNWKSLYNSLKCAECVYVRNLKTFNPRDEITIVMPYIGCGLAGGNNIDFINTVEDYVQLYKHKVKVIIVKYLEK